MSVFAALAGRAPGDGSDVATSVLDDEGEPLRQLTWNELYEEARQASSWLRAVGLVPGDVVALQLRSRLDFLVLHLGALAAGLVTLPLNPAYTDEELAYYLSDSGARAAVLIRPTSRPDVSVFSETEAIEAVRTAQPGEVAAVDPEAIAVVLYTSGTTGRPKGAMIRHRNVLATVAALHEAWRWSSEDVLIHALPLFHVHGLFVAMFGALYAGARTVLLARFDVAWVLHSIDRYGGTVFMGVPTFYGRFVSSALEIRPDLSTMRLFTSGSAALPASVHAAFEARFGHSIVERYGMTEVGIVLSNPYDGERRPGTVGHPLPGVVARVVQPETGQPAADDEIGEIQIAGPSVFAGYLGRPEATTEALDGAWMRTGDLGRVDADGYFHVVGRARDLVITGGLNVYPSEVEAVLAAHPAVREVAVVGAPDPDLNERVVASVVADAGLDPNALIGFARERLAAYKCPRSVRIAPQLPRNTLGKVQKHLLRASWSEPTFRPGSADDLEAIVRWNRALAAETEGLALDPERVRRGVQAVLRGEVDARYHVVEIADCGVGQAMITREWSDWRNGWVWWFQSVYVEPALRRRGIFAALYAHVREAARRDGAVGLRLYVDRRNQPAIEVYRRLGMEGDHYACFEDMLDPASS